MEGGGIEGVGGGGWWGWTYFPAQGDEPGWFGFGVLVFLTIVYVC